jgi:hypothetical protein
MPPSREGEAPAEPHLAMAGVTSVEHNSHERW